MPGGAVRVNLHLITGEVLQLTLCPAEKRQISRELAKAAPDKGLLRLPVSGHELEIPWRSIAYLSVPGNGKIPVDSGQPASHEV